MFAEHEVVQSVIFVWKGCTDQVSGVNNYYFLVVFFWHPPKKSFSNTQPTDDGFQAYTQKMFGTVGRSKECEATCADHQKDQLIR